MSQAQQTRGAKMAAAKVMFATIAATGYTNTTKAEGPRAEFINRMIAEHGMTKNGAATYWQGLKNQQKGGKLYYTAKKKAMTATFVDVQPAAEAEPKPRNLRRAKKSEAATV